jgi:hypothetical protein
MKKPVAIGVAVCMAGIAGLFGSQAAMAGGVNWSVNIGAPPVVYAAPPVVYAAPQPVYVEPAPVYVQPQPVYVAPAPVVQYRRVYYYDAYNRPYYFEHGRRHYHHW